ncbi:trans-sulfuration enzyme family protein [Variovorax paradoxus]|uniref:trans-sulfuration enzyme family protein n=1 Tax=Variovorax paradoxus TaxID=34073 RepID=UPI0029C99277|nr:PLP-dependent aspartate aminotransferase family protein [Variovorax paradoxus]WPH22134.1 PLP-dependent aspartate aminotransferase family protein [Variovorax paradoxus]
MNAPTPTLDTSAAGAFASLAPPVWRASTVVFDSLDDFVNRRTRLPDGFSYGTTGTPTQRALETRIAELDGAAHCVVFPSGQAAICGALLALLKKGDHLLMTDAAYGLAKSFAVERLQALGVEVEFYPPRIGADIERLIRPSTRLIWLESPGTVTMEVEDVPAITAAARARGVLTAIDNTWASPLGFAALAHGVDLCIHACTKYMGGHSDVLMGSIATNDEKLYRSVRGLQSLMGLAVSPEDCFLVARGLDTMQVRMERQAASAQLIAASLATHPLVRLMLFPALPGAPDHALWARDFRQAGCVMSLQLAEAPYDAYRAMFRELELFSIGASWGGVRSIAAFYPAQELARRSFCDVHGPVIRLSVGLQDPQALLDELLGALSAFQKSSTL